MMNILSSSSASRIGFLVMLWSMGQAHAGPILFGAAHDGRDGPSSFYTIDTATGAATFVGDIGFERVSGMDFHPVTGVLYATGERDDGSDTHVLLTINPLTGVGTEIGPTGVESFSDGSFYTGSLLGKDTASDISFRNSDNKLIAYTFDNDGTADTNLGTGAMTELSDSTTESSDFGGLTFFGGYGLAFDPSDELLLAVDNRLVTLDQFGSGTSSPITLNNVDGRFNALDYHPGTGVLFGSLISDNGCAPSFNCLASINTSTGMATIFGSTAYGLDAIAFQIDPVGVPEPATLGLLGAGLIGLAWRRRRA